MAASPTRQAATPLAPAAPAGTGLIRLLAYPLFLGSGAAGLIYEVVWTRMLLNTFGTGVYAVAAVLAAFMAGLALGAWLLGGIGDRIGRPLRLYGGLEIAIGIFGMAAPFLLGRVDLVDRWAYAAFGQNFGALTTMRFSVAFALLLIPTTMMGATLPVMARFMVRQGRHLGLHVGALYAINTAGAVLGTFTAGFVLIGALGLFATEFVAVGLNLGVGLAAMALSLIIERRPLAPESAEPARAPVVRQPDSEEPADAGVIRWVMFTAFMTGAMALSAQVLWTRTLIYSVDYLKATTYAFTAMLTVFLAGLAIGSALVGLFIDSQRRPLQLYGKLLTLLGGSIILSVALLHGAGIRLGEPLAADGATLNWTLAVSNVMLQSLAVLGIPTLLMGMAFPVAVRVVARVGRVSGDVGRLYAVNTVGAIIGSVLAAFVIIPKVGLVNGLILVGLVDAVLGLATLARAGGSRLHLGVLGGLTALVLALAVTHPVRRDGLQALNSLLDRIVFYEEGPLATVSVIENNIGERTIYVDDVGVAGTDPVLQTDQKSLAHVPMMLLENPRSALTVGFGSGGASFSLMLHDTLEQVHCVEICPTVLRAAPHLRAANHLFFARELPVSQAQPGMTLARAAAGFNGTEFAPGTVLTADQIGQIVAGGAEPMLAVGTPLEFSRQSEKYELILDDARSYLRYTDQRYDFIATDCTDLRYKSNANLYDVEYFEACRARLTEDGIVVVWMPLAGLDTEIFRTALRTFRHVFPEMGIFFMSNEPTHYILMIGWQGEPKLDYRLFERRLAEADVRMDLAELHLDDSVKLMSCFITGGEALADFVAGDELNTENNPVIEFRSPRYGYGSRPLIDNLAALMERRVSPREWLVAGSMPENEMERLARYEQALPLILSGHAAVRNLDVERATLDYMAARQLAPEDISLAVHLNFPILQKRIEIEPTNSLMHIWLGRALMLQDKLGGARLLLERAEALLQENLSGPPKPGQPEYQRALDAERLPAVRAWLAEIERRGPPPEPPRP